MYASQKTKILAVVALAVLLPACTQISPFREPYREKGQLAATNPYPELTSVGTINSPLASNERSQQVSGILADQSITNRSNAAGQTATAARPDIEGPQRVLAPNEIQNIPASGTTVASAQARANADLTALGNRKRTADERKIELERTKSLRQATIAAVTKSRQEKAAQVQARNRAIQQRNQQIAQQREAFEKRKAEVQAMRAKMVAAYTDIPEPQSNKDLFALKDVEQVAIVYFDSGTPVVKDTDKAVLLEAARLLKAKGGKLLIVGHSSPPTDGIITRENREANIRVSKNRTQVVAIELRKIGVPAQLMQLEAVADTKPVYSINSPKGQSGNRRVEIYRIVAKKEAS